MTPEEYEKYREYWKDQPKYIELKERLNEQAKQLYKALNLNDAKIVNLGVRNMPLGYLCIEHDKGFANEFSLKSVYEFQWIDFEGTLSERFSDKWKAYHSAMNRLYPWDCLTETDKELIKKYDDHLNTRTKTVTLREKEGIGKKVIQFTKGQSKI